MFELYHSLEAQIKNIKKIDPAEIRDKISQLDIEGQTFVYALIYYHYKMADKEPPPIEYTVSIDLSLLTDKLLKILFVFVQMHLQRMKETAAMQQAAQKVLEQIE